MRLACGRARPRDRELSNRSKSTAIWIYRKSVSARRRNQHAGRMRYPKQIHNLVNANCVSNSCREPVRIIGAEREFSVIAQLDRDSVEAGNIVKPAVGRQMNAPTMPPANANGLASDNLRKPHPLADHANTK